MVSLNGTKVNVQVNEVFKYGDFPVRVLLFDGDPWFVAAEVCAVLDIANVSDAVSSLDNDEKQQVRSIIANPDVAPGGRDPWLISEPGLYSLVLRSRKPEAKTFKRWITHEVIPAIRKNGVYGETPVEAVLDRLSPRQLAELILKESDRADEAEAQVAELRPLAEIAQVVAVSAEDHGRSWAVDEVAKLLSSDPNIKIGRNRLFEKMIEWGWVFHSSGDRRLHAKQKEIETTKRLTVKLYSPRYDADRGEIVDLTPQVRVTWKGMMEIHRRLKGQVPLQQLVERYEAPIQLPLDEAE